MLKQIRPGQNPPLFRTAILFVRICILLFGLTLGTGLGMVVYAEDSSGVERVWSFTYFGPSTSVGTKSCFPRDLESRAMFQSILQHLMRTERLKKRVENLLRNLRLTGRVIIIPGLTHPEKILFFRQM